MECPSIHGCVSQGETKDQALENIEDAIAACLQVRLDRGLFQLSGSGGKHSSN